MDEANLIMLLSGLLAGLLAGAIGGTLAGLAGIGGGLIYVPMFYACLPSQSDGMPIAIFASLLAIVATGFASTRAHWRLGHIDKTASYQLLPGLIIFASFGLMLTLRLPEALILTALALLDGWLAWDYGRIVKTKPDNAPLTLASMPIGYVSGSLGIGGGTMLVPLLRRSLPLRIAVGTSSLCGTAMAFCALLINLLLVDDWLALLQTPLFFLIGAGVGLLLILPHSSAWAARLHARFNEAEMRQLLKLLFALLAALLTLAALKQAFV